MFEANAGHLASQFGESTVVYVEPNDDPATTYAVPGCLVSDEETERRTSAEGELQVVKKRDFTFEVSGVEVSVVVGGTLTFNSRQYFVELTEDQVGGWLHASGIYIGRKEMSKDILKG